MRKSLALDSSELPIKNREISHAKVTSGAKAELEFTRKISMIKQAKTFDDVVNILGLDGFKEVMYELYNVQGISMERIARELGKDYRTVNRWIKELKIKPRPNIAPIHLSKIVPHRWMEETKLDVINGKPVRLTLLYPTNDLSYFMGFAIGDGWVGSTMIELCNTDFGLLNPLSSLMNRIKSRHGGRIGLQYRELNWENRC